MIKKEAHTSARVRRVRVLLVCGSNSLVWASYEVIGLFYYVAPFAVALYVRVCVRGRVLALTAINCQVSYN